MLFVLDMYPILVIDFVNFGKRNELPLNLPRILCWKGSMINKYASYDHVSGEKYGKRSVSLGLRFYKCCHVCFVLV